MNEQLELDSLDRALEDVPTPSFYDNDGFRVVFIMLGAFCGALLRWKITVSVAAINSEWTRWSTVGINCVGSCLLGVIGGFGSRLPAPYSLAVGVGFCGSFTTFSTYAVDVVRLLAGSDVSSIGECLLLIFLSNVLSIGFASLSFLLVTRGLN